MRARRLYIAVFLFAALAMAAQVRVIKPVKKAKPRTTRLSFYGGLSSSELLLERNIQENNSAPGFHLGVGYGLTRVFRTVFEYTNYNEINIAPTWSGIKGKAYELNVHALAKMGDLPAYFYPLMGVSYNIFEGYFTGEKDYLHLARMYEKNTNVDTKWLGMNFGLGLEIFIKRFSLFGEFKMRIGETESGQISVMDVCFSTGLRYNLVVPSIYKMFSGTRSRYLLDTKESDY